MSLWSWRRGKQRVYNESQCNFLFLTELSNFDEVTGVNVKTVRRTLVEN